MTSINRQMQRIPLLRRIVCVLGFLYILLMIANWKATNVTTTTMTTNGTIKTINKKNGLDGNIPITDSSMTSSSLSSSSSSSLLMFPNNKNQEWKIPLSTITTKSGVVIAPNNLFPEPTNDNGKNNNNQSSNNQKRKETKDLIQVGKKNENISKNYKAPPPSPIVISDAVDPSAKLLINNLKSQQQSRPQQQQLQQSQQQDEENSKETTTIKLPNKIHHHHHPVDNSNMTTLGATSNIKAKIKLPNGGMKRRPKLLVSREEAEKIENPIQLHDELKSFYKDFTTKSIQNNNNNNNNNSNSNNNTLSTTTFNLWDKSKTLPEWMKTYLNWHKYQREQLAKIYDQNGLNIDNNNIIIINNDNNNNNNNNSSDNSNFRFFVLQCLASDDAHCGGTSDRLKPIPWAIRIAYYTRRILLIHWTKPAELQEFLVPPKHGLDWRAPGWLAKQLERNKAFGTKSIVEAEIRALARTNETLVRSRFQSFHAGMYWYDDQLIDGEHRFSEIFHDLWQLTFTPSEPVKALLEGEMTRIGLIPGKYTAAHLRVLYGIDDRPEWVKESWAENALNCASELRPQTPIFFSSDSMNATYYARVYATRKNATIFTRVPNPNPPLHIDKAKGWLMRPVTDYYDTFVDLYIMAQADCVTYNKGGYGIFALLIGRNSTCGVRQDAIDRPKILNPCVWVDNLINGTNVTRDHYQQERGKQAQTHDQQVQHKSNSNEPIYLEPITSSKKA